ncbi:MAG: CoA transferase [Gammaproteobacteria bacterium]|nr:CoA transferase [Gammaproteobacteria bacterium]
MQNILSGVRIVEASAFIAAPMCGMTLAQLGADVIRFDQIGGGIDYRRWPVTADNTSIYWADMNKGKRSFAVDLRKDEGRELVTRLICAPGPGAGIMSTNLPARGWVDFENLKKRRADVIQLAIVGDRHGGTAVDYTVNCKVGFPHLTGPEDDDRPVNHVLPAWDIATAYLAATSILAALRYRDQTGQGQKIELALADTALATMGNLGYIGEQLITGKRRKRGGNYVYGAYGRDFETRDGERIMVMAVSHKMWLGILAASGLTETMNALAAELGLDFDKEGDRYAARHRISGLLAAWVAARPCAEVSRAFDAQGVCWGRYQSVAELIEKDPDCSPDNPIFHLVEQPDIGTYPVPGMPMTFTAVQRGPARRAPRLGEHTDEILADILGLSSSEIGTLHDEKIVAGPRA